MVPATPSNPNVSIASAAAGAEPDIVFIIISLSIFSTLILFEQRYLQVYLTYSFLYGLW